MHNGSRRATSTNCSRCQWCQVNCKAAAQGSIVLYVQAKPLAARELDQPGSLYFTDMHEDGLATVHQSDLAHAAASVVEHNHPNQWPTPLLAD